MYVVVLAEAHPELANFRKVYLALIMVAARGNGGDGWVTCGSFFCHNLAVDPLVNWGRLDPTLHTATFATSSMGPGLVSHTARLVAGVLGTTILGPLSGQEVCGPGRRLRAGVDQGQGGPTVRGPFPHPFLSA